MRRIPIIVDHKGTVQHLLKVVDFIPTRYQDQDVALQIPTKWLSEQFCPEHPLARNPNDLTKGWTHIRACWDNHDFHERPGIMFACPRGHFWKVIFNQSLPEERSF